MKTLRPENGNFELLMTFRFLFSSYSSNAHIDGAEHLFALEKVPQNVSKITPLHENAVT